MHTSQTESCCIFSGAVPQIAVTSSTAFRFPSLPVQREILKTAETSRDVKPHSPESDEALMARVCLEDQDALASLFRRYARVVWTIAYRVLRDESEAEDVLQEVFLRVYGKCKMFKPSKGPVRAWILQVAYHEALCRRRYLSSRHFYTNLDMNESSAATQGCLSKATDAIDALVGRGGLRNAFQALSENQRQTLCLFFFEGCTLAEIAAKLEQPRGRVKNHYFRGLDRLRREICRNSRGDLETK
jgi:RNA polymerase sigma-70 factor, ECF subfamily